MRIGKLVARVKQSNIMPRLGQRSGSLPKMRRFKLLAVLALLLIPATAMANANNEADNANKPSNDTMTKQTTSSDETNVQSEGTTVSGNSDQQSSDQQSTGSTGASASAGSHSTSVTTTTVTNNGASSGTSVTINGKTTHLGPNDYISKNIDSGDGNSSQVNVFVNSDSDSGSSSSMNFQMNTDQTGGSSDETP